MFKLFLLSSDLWRAAVGCWIVECCIDHWCVDVSWVWRVWNHNAGVWLHDNNNIRNDQLLHWGLQVLHHQCSRLLFKNISCPELLHSSPEVLFYPEFHHQVIGVLHNYVCSASLLHRGSQVLLCSQLLHRGSSVSHHQRSKITQKWQRTTLPRATQPQLRRPSIT